MLMNGFRFYPSEGMFLEVIDGGMPIQNSGGVCSQNFEYFGVPVPNPLTDRSRQKYSNVSSFDSRDDLASSVDDLSDHGDDRDDFPCHRQREVVTLKVSADRKRQDRNSREQQRTYKISQQIDNLKDLLDSSGIKVMNSKYGILSGVAEYLQKLQVESMSLENEIRRLQENNFTVPAVDDVDGIYQRGEAGTRIQTPKYTNVCLNSPIPLAVASLDGKFVECNDLFLEATGWGKDTLSAYSLFKIVDASRLQTAYIRIGEMLQSQSQSQSGGNNNDSNVVIAAVTAKTSSVNSYTNTNLNLNATISNKGITDASSQQGRTKRANSYQDDTTAAVVSATCVLQQSPLHRQCQGQGQGQGMKQPQLQYHATLHPQSGAGSRLPRTQSNLLTGGPSNSSARHCPTNLGHSVSVDSGDYSNVNAYSNVINDSDYNRNSYNHSISRDNSYNSDGITTSSVAATNSTITTSFTPSFTPSFHLAASTGSLPQLTAAFSSSTAHRPSAISTPSFSSSPLLTSYTSDKASLASNAAAAVAAAADHFYVRSTLSAPQYQDQDQVEVEVEVEPIYLGVSLVRDGGMQPKYFSVALLPASELW